MALLVKSLNGLDFASVKSRNGLAVASIKSINGLDTTSPAGDPAYLTGQSLGTLRSDFSGQVGFAVDVNDSSIVVTELGRWVVSGNSQTHVVGIYTSTAGIGAPLGYVTVNTSGATAGQYLYATLASPVTLTGGGNRYHIFTTEVATLDQWYNDDTGVTPTAAPVMVGSSYYFTGFFTNTLGNFAFGPVNFKFH